MCIWHTNKICFECMQFCCCGRMVSRMKKTAIWFRARFDVVAILIFIIFMCAIQLRLQHIFSGWLIQSESRRLNQCFGWGISCKSCVSTKCFVRVASTVFEWWSVHFVLLRCCSTMHHNYMHAHFLRHLSSIACSHLDEKQWWQRWQQHEPSP